MRHLQTAFCAAILGFAVTAISTPAAATTKDQAKDMCTKRDKECVSFGLGTNPEDDLLVCVDNRSSGQGVQCVRCQGDNACTVLRPAPTGKPGLPEVDAVLTDSQPSANLSALEGRLKSLEDRLKALESARK